MNEDAARDVLLVRAVEGADGERALITDADRQHAARAAAELARWSAGERGEQASGELFLAQRAGLLRGKVVARERVFAGAVQALAWRPWIGLAVPLAALLFGAFFQQVGDRQHINVLAFPLLSIVLWNLIVYLLLTGRLLLSPLRPPPRLSALRRAVAGVAQRRASRLRGVAARAFGALLDDWADASAPLLRARAARVLHVAAAMLALGAVAGLYVRGLVFEYRAGWESTFLDAAQVHAILSSVLGPAANALGMAFPGVSELNALRLPGSGGENAARWIHWYALTVGALVVVPRLLLAAYAGWRERRLSRNFPLPLHDPYYRRLLAGFSPHPVRLRVVPYSYTTEESSRSGLDAVAKGLLGDTAEVALRPVVPFGSEESAATGLEVRDPATALTIALFSLAATPEHENHGRFIDTLRSALDSKLIALVDEAVYRRRLGDQPAALDRLAERRQAWRAFGAAHAITVAFVDLTAPDLAQLERDAGAVLAA